MQRHVAPVALPGLQALRELRRGEAVAAFVEHHAARALGQRGFEAPASAAISCSALREPRGSAFTAFSSSRISGGKRLAKSA